MNNNKVYEINLYLTKHRNLKLFEISAFKSPGLFGDF